MSEDSFLGIPDHWWSKAGKLAAALTLLWFLYLGGDALLGGEDEASVDATLTAHDFRWPPDLSNQLQVLCTQLIGPAQVHFPNEAELSEAQANLIRTHLDSISESPCAGFSRQGPPDWRNLESIFQGRIRNSGGRSAESVSLIIPGSIVTVIQREGSHAQLYKGRERLDLGTIRPGETVEVVTWSNERYTGRGVGFPEEELRLLHSGGETEVAVLFPTNSLFQSLYHATSGTSAWWWVAFGISVSGLLWAVRSFYESMLQLREVSDAVSDNTVS